MKKNAPVFYGWWIVAGSFGIIFVNAAVGFYSFSIFLKPLMEVFGWSRAQISLAQSISALVAGISSIVVGKLIQRYSIKKVVAFSALLAGSTCILLSFVTSLWQFYILYVLLGIGLGGGAGLIPTSTAISNWFKKRRGRAMGLATAGTAIGAMIIAPLVGYIINTHGWQAGYIFMGIMVFVIDIPIALFLLKERPEDMGLFPDNETPGIVPDHKTTGFNPSFDTQLLAKETNLSTYFRSPVLWLLGFAFFLANIGEMGVLIHQVAHLTDIGLSATIAAGALGFTGGTGGLGKIVLGSLTERISTRYVILLCFSIQTIGVALLVMANSMEMIWAFVFVFGFGFGGVATLMPLAVGGCFPLAAFSVIYGFIHFMYLGGSLIGPPLAGLTYDLTNSYLGAFKTFIGTFILASICAYFAWGKNPRPFFAHRSTSST